MNEATNRINDEAELLSRLRQMSELLEQERGAIVDANTDALEEIAGKKHRLTNILATVSPDLLAALGKTSDEPISAMRKEIEQLIAQSSAKNSINGSMLTQAKNMTEKSIGILLSCTERNPVELYDEQGRVPDPTKKRELGAA